MMDTLTAPAAAPATGKRPSAAWLHALRMAFMLAVRGLENGKLPSQTPRTQVLLTPEELRAVLDAARRAATRQARRTVR